MITPDRISRILILLIMMSALLITGCDTEKKTEEANLQLLKKVYEEGVNKQNLEVLESALAEDYTRHCQAMPPGFELIEGRDQMMEFFREHFASFPDWHEDIDIKAVDGNTIAYTSTGTGTQTGQVGDLPPTGKSCNLEHIIIQRFEDGKIAETWVLWDNLTFLTQLGHIPPISGEAPRGNGTDQ